MNKLILLLCLYLSSFSLFAITIDGTVVKIHDGDTFTVKLAGEESGKPRVVRFLGVDTPEVDFNGHTQGEIAFIARDHLISLVPIGSQVSIKVESEWQLKQRRILGTVFFDGQDINLKMIESGLAAPYFILPFDKKIMSRYSEAAKVAYEEKRGIYALGEIMPYEFRMISEHREGTNFVGDLETKLLYYPNEVTRIAPYKRVFIKGLEQAQSRGYRLRE